MKTKLTTLLVVIGLAGTLIAGEGPVPKGSSLDHVFVIMMENHGYGQIVGNPVAPFANALEKSANSANWYFAIGHPSSTNYLEVVGGSNFGVRSDNPPDFHNRNCTPNLGTPGTTNLDGPVSSGPVCPIAGTGTDAETPAVDTTNECPSSAPCPPGLISIDGSSIPAAQNIVGKTIADQLVEHGKNWKSYQESLPPTGADNIAYSDGYFTDNVKINPVPSTLPALLKLYAAKHNPFVYFRSVQEHEMSGLSLARVAGFEGANGLYEDLASGQMPNLSFIAPNQCNDQHGRGNGGSVCGFDPVTNGLQAGLNHGLIYVGDLTLRHLVKTIHSSPAWLNGRNAIVILWDENDYSLATGGYLNWNRVLVIVDTNYGVAGVHSFKRYSHFSLLKSLEAGFGLPCLNHACDDTTPVMSDVFWGQ